MKKLSKKNMILLIIVLLLMLILGSTFAYFGWSSTSNDKDLLVDVTVSGNDNSCVKASDNNKLLIPTSSREKGRIITMTAKQTLASNAKITWDLTVNRINKTETTTSGLKSSTFKYELVNSTTGVSYGSGNFENITNGSKISFSTNNETIDYNKEYTFTLYLWIDGNLGTNSISMSNQTYDFDINCNITGTDNKINPKVNLSTYISNLYSESDKTVVTNNNIEYNYAPSVNLMNDRLGGTTTSLDGGNIRYYGKSPNNYIYFNCDDYSNQTSDTCELWRIIGVFDGKVKIMRNTLLGKFSWDYDYNDGEGKTTYNNNWHTSSLQKLLNNQYYNNIDTVYYSYDASNKSLISSNVNFETDKTGLKNDTTRIMIAEVNYSLGGSNSKSVYSDQIYKYERHATVSVGNQINWTGKIALAYPSDYSYAADFNSCKQDLISYNNSTCTSVNWMKSVFDNSYYWLLTHNYDRFDYVYYVASLGYISNLSNVFLANAVIPVLYLNSDVIIESANVGTSSDPYRISAS